MMKPNSARPASLDDTFRAHCQQRREAAGLSPFQQHLIRQAARKAQLDREDAIIRCAAFWFDAAMRAVGGLIVAGTVALWVYAMVWGIPA